MVGTFLVTRAVDCYPSENVRFMKSLLILPLSLMLCACGPSFGPSIITPNGSPTQDKLGFLPTQAETRRPVLQLSTSGAIRVERQLGF